jgi:hypothetical protein
MVFGKLKAISKREGKIFAEKALFSFWFTLKNEKLQVVTISLTVHLVNPLSSNIWQFKILYILRQGQTNIG